MASRSCTSVLRARRLLSTFQAPASLHRSASACLGRTFLHTSPPAAAPTRPASLFPPSRLSIAHPIASTAAAPAGVTARFSTSAHRSAEQEYDEDEMRERRRWIANFENVQLRREDFDTSFARSSGPGGQNVNKLNTKAEIRVNLSQASDQPAPPGTPDASPRRWLNRQLASKLAKQSTYYVASSHSLLVTSMRHRTQEANLQDALEKLHAHILEIASEGLVGETSDEQRQRVRRLQAAEERRKKANKIKRSDVKSGRKFKG